MADEVLYLFAPDLLWRKSARLLPEDGFSGMNDR